MDRNKRGQFNPGTSGNLRGRPRKKPPEICNEQSRNGFFEAAETPIAIVENGRRKLIPARVAIDKQLVLKAAAGDMRAIAAYYKRSDRLTVEFINEQLELVKMLLQGAEAIRKFPEEVTDEFKRLLALMKAKIDPGFGFQ